MFKKSIIFLLIMLLLPYYTFADDINEASDDLILEEVSTTVSEEPKINSRAAIVFDRTSKTILYEKDIYTKRPMASTTKIMTATLILESGNLSDVVTVSAKAAGTGGSRLGLHTNDKITVMDLLYGLLLCSGNDSAVALAEYMSGSVEEFANLMNAKAKELNLTNTNFVTPHGLDNDNHYTTAYELALLTDYALNNETFSKIVNTKSYTVTINGYSKSLSNTNELLGYLSGVNGVKTGFTGNAGRCLVTSCNRDNFNIITVVLGADTKKIRTTDSINLIEYTYNNFKINNCYSLIQNEFDSWIQENLNNITVNKSSNSLKLKLQEIDNYNIAINKSSLNNIYVDIHSVSILESPIYENEKIGVLEVKCNDDTVISLDILVAETLTRKNEFEYFINLLSNFNNYFKFNV